MRERKCLQTVIEEVGNFSSGRIRFETDFLHLAGTDYSLLQRNKSYLRPWFGDKLILLIHCSKKQNLVVVIQEKFSGFETAPIGGKFTIGIHYKIQPLMDIAFPVVNFYRWKPHRGCFAGFSGPNGPKCSIRFQCAAQKELDHIRQPSKVSAFVSGVSILKNIPGISQTWPNATERNSVSGGDAQ